VVDVRFDIYGRYELEVLREGNQWKVFSVGAGKRELLNDVVIPNDVEQQEIEVAPQF
jgi:hypothetical protein